MARTSKADDRETGRNPRGRGSGFDDWDSRGATDLVLAPRVNLPDWHQAIGTYCPRPRRFEPVLACARCADRCDLESGGVERGGGKRPPRQIGAWLFAQPISK